MGKDHGKIGINRQSGLTARTKDFNRGCRLLRHAIIVRQTRRPARNDFASKTGTPYFVLAAGGFSPWRIPERAEARVAAPAWAQPPAAAAKAELAAAAELFPAAACLQSAA